MTLADLHIPDLLVLALLIAEFTAIIALVLFGIRQRRKP